MGGHQWFYSTGRGQRGPVPLDRLVAELCRLPTPHAASVWREGMEAWAKAGDVAEITAKLPPPLVPGGPGRTAVGKALTIGVVVGLSLSVCIALVRVLVILPALLRPTAAFPGLGALGPLDALGLLAFLCTAVLFIAWVYRAAATVATWPGPRTRGPAWHTVVHWFIPIVCLFRPFQDVRDIWVRSLDEAGGGPEAQTKKPVETAWVATWWTAFILAGVVGVAFSHLKSAEFTAAPRLGCLALLAGQVCLITAGATAALVVLTVRRAQAYVSTPPALRSPAGVIPPLGGAATPLRAMAVAAALTGFAAVVATQVNANAVQRQSAFTPATAQQASPVDGKAEAASTPAVEPPVPPEGQPTADLMAGADAALRAGRYAEAESWLREYLRAHPADAGAYARMSEVLSQLDRSSEAEGTARQALTLQPESDAASVALSRALAQGGRFDDARGYLERLVAERPRSARLREGLGWLLVEQGQGLLRSQVLSSPEVFGHPTPEVTAKAGRIAALGRVALATFQAGVQLDPSSAEALCGIAAAIRVIEEASRMGTDILDFSQAQRDRARRELPERERLRDLREKSARAAVQLQPNWAGGHYELAMALAGVGSEGGTPTPERLEEGIAHFETTVQLVPTRSDSWVSYLGALVLHHRFSDARLVIERGVAAGGFGEEEAANQRMIVNTMESLKGRR